MKKLEIERRFLLLLPPSFFGEHLLKPLITEKYSILQIYLKKSFKKAGNRRIREIYDSKKNSHSYFLTEKQSTKNPVVRVENEREISKEEFKKLEAEMDRSRDPIFKRRVCFEWKKQEFELDFFIAPKRIFGLVILEIELENPKQKVILPDFLPIAVEITNSPDLSNSNLAKRP